MCVLSVQMCAPVMMCVDVREQILEFFPFTMWVPKIELRLSDFTRNTLIG